MGAAGDGRGGHGHARGWAEVPITGLREGDLERDLRSAGVAALSELSLVRRTATVVVVTVEVAVTALHDVT